MTTTLHDPPRVFVTGHQGMLGQTVSRVLGEAGVLVLTTSERFSAQRPSAYIAAVWRESPDVIVNCAAVLPNRGRSPQEMLEVNGVLPQLLATSLTGPRVLIHASSDGVFSGLRGGYTVADRPDATDDYGISKRLGELARSAGPTVVLRASIIGPEGGLMGWLLEQRGTVYGYESQHWNGITTLQWAELCTEIVCDRGRWTPRIEQPATKPPVTKLDLLRKVAATWSLDVELRPSAAPSIDRTLVPTLAVPSIDLQLQRLRQWHGRAA